MSFLSRMAQTGRLDEAVFNASCVPVIASLWTMTDRTVRTALLNSLKPLSPLIPAPIVNKSIFDQLVAGFSDSNAKYDTIRLTVVCDVMWCAIAFKRLK
jgi:hypothetical protein